MAEDKKTTAKKIKAPIKVDAQSLAKTKTHRPTHKIDADGKVLGRLASEVASLLRGKHSPSFQYHMDQGDNVVVSNISKLKVTGKKMDQKIYYNHSGYPGGLRERQMGHVFAKDPAEVFRMAVINMLPKNKLRAQMIKRLTINK